MSPTGSLSGRRRIFRPASPLNWKIDPRPSAMPPSPRTTLSRGGRRKQKVPSPKGRRLCHHPLAQPFREGPDRIAGQVY